MRSKPEGSLHVFGTISRINLLLWINCQFHFRSLSPDTASRPNTPYLTTQCSIIQTTVTIDWSADILRDVSRGHSQRSSSAAAAADLLANHQRIHPPIHIVDHDVDIWLCHRHLRRAPGGTVLRRVELIDPARRRRRPSDRARMSTLCAARPSLGHSCAREYRRYASLDVLTERTMDCHGRAPCYTCPRRLQTIIGVVRQWIGSQGPGRLSQTSECFVVDIIGITNSYMQWCAGDGSIASILIPRCRETAIGERVNSHLAPAILSTLP